MLNLYYKPTCAFSQRVIQMAENLKVELDLKDISDSEEAMNELLEKGGKEQTPFLVDTEKGVTMYEASDIIEYMRDNYANTEAGSSIEARPRIHVGGSVCESCEG